MAGNGITFDDTSTGVSYEQFPKDPAAREAIAIVNDKVEALKDSTVSRQDVINLENKVKQSDLDKENFKIAVNKELTDVKTIVEGIDGGNTAKLEELEAVVNDKANKDLVDSLVYQIEGSVKKINGNVPDEEGNVIIDLNTTGLATKEEVQAKTDEIETLIFTKAERSNVEMLETQIEGKASAASVNTISKSISTPASFGAVADGLTDDSRAVQDAIIFAQETGAILDGLGKTYLISDVLGKIPSNIGSFREDYGLYISKSITIKNMKLLLKSGSKDFTSVLNIFSPKGTFVNLENVFINGNRNNQMHTASREDGGMHGIRVYGNTISQETGVIHISGCSVDECETDGLLIRGLKPDLIVVENSKFVRNTRNGFTDNCLDNIIVRNCQFIDTTGSPPQSGYHCEPDQNTNFKNRVIESCKAYGNSGWGFGFDVRPGSLEGLIISNCMTDTEIAFAMESTDLLPRIYKNFTVTDCTAKTIIFSTNTTAGALGRGKFENVTLRNCKTNFIQLKSSGESTGENITISNCTGQIEALGNFDGVTVKDHKNVSDKANNRMFNGNVFLGDLTKFFKNIVFENCEHIVTVANTQQHGIHIVGDFNENITIRNSKITTPGYSVYVKADRLLIEGNYFGSRTSNDYILRTTNATNVKIMNNTLRNYDVFKDAAPLGSINSLPTDTMYVNNSVLKGVGQ